MVDHIPNHIYAAAVCAITFCIAFFSRMIGNAGPAMTVSFRPAGTHEIPNKEFRYLVEELVSS